MRALRSMPLTGVRRKIACESSKNIEYGTDMKTQKRFSPELLDRFRRLGRGEGEYEKYIPWHRVGRSDPSSYGRSHLWRRLDRQHELLSDLELIVFYFSTMLPSVVDIREQFPLKLLNAKHELDKPRWKRPWSNIHYPGTQQIALQMSARHPKVSSKDRSASWVMTTDLLITLKSPQGCDELLAVSVKPNGEVDDGRTHEKLAIEREYWKLRQVPWLLITPALYHSSVADTLRITTGWAFSKAASDSGITHVAMSADQLNGRSLTYAYETLAGYFGNRETARDAFWQAVWCGRLPIDMRRGWRPHEPIRILSSEDFWRLNPIASRRTSWPA